MAKFQHKDIIQSGNPFADAEKGLKSLLEIINKSTEDTKAFVKQLSDIARKGSTKEVSDVTKLLELKNKLTVLEKRLIENKNVSIKATKQISELEKQRIKIGKDLNTTLAKNLVVGEKSNKILQKGKTLLQERNKTLKDQVVLERTAAGSIEKLRLETNKLVKSRDKLGDISGKNAKQFQKLTTSIAKNETKLQNYDKQINRSQRVVGRYKDALGGLRSLFIKGLGILGLTAGVQGLANAFRKTITIFSGFSKETSKLQAITGGTTKEIQKLTDQAKFLGNTTQKTAQEVLQLQIEYSKLGFGVDEIEAATEATLALSIATGEGLALSAEVAGATLRGFGLEAVETQRVVDVMANSFSNSALNLEKFRESMKLVAPIANAANIDLETTTGILGVLADAGIAGSIAGTGLKNVLSKLSNENSVLSKELGFTVKNSEDLIKAFKQLEKGNIDLTKATELTDERSKGVFLTMIKGIGSIEKLKASLDNAEGSALRMATIMADNLAGDTDKAKSAMEGLAISVGERLEPGLRRSVQAFTRFIGKIQEIVKINVAEEIEREREEVIKLTGALQDTNLNEEDRLLALEKLKEIAPEVAKGVTLEAESFVLLNKQLNEYIELSIQSIALAQLEAELLKESNKLNKIKGKQANTLNQGFKTLIEVSDKYRVSEGSLEQQIRGTISALQKEVDLQEKLGKTGEVLVNRAGFVNDARTEEQKQLIDLIGTLSFFNKKQEDANEITEESINPLKSRVEALKELLGINKDINKEDEKVGGESGKKLARERIELAKLTSLGIQAIEVETTEQTLHEQQIRLSQLTDKERQILEIRREFNLASNEELYALELDQLNTYYDDNRLPIDETYYAAVALIAKKTAKKTTDISKKTAETEKKIAKEKTAILLQGAADLLNGFQALANVRTQNEIKEIDRRQEAALNGFTGTEEAKVKLSEKFEAEKLEIQKEAFERNKKIAIIEALINGAIAITSATKYTLVASILIPLIIASTALQVGVIASQKFKDGVIGFEGYGSETSDSNVVSISDKESIIKAKSSKQSTSLLTAVNEGYVNDEDYKRWTDFDTMNNLAMSQIQTKLIPVNNTNNIDITGLIAQQKITNDLISSAQLIIPVNGEYIAIDRRGNQFKYS